MISWRDRSRGPGLTFVEAAAVLPEGRMAPQDSGIWSDAHIKLEPLYSVCFSISTHLIASNDKTLKDIRTNRGISSGITALTISRFNRIRFSKLPSY